MVNKPAPATCLKTDRGEPVHHRRSPAGVTRAQRVWTGTALVAIVLLGAALRFYRMNSVGVLMYDDAAFMNLSGTMLAACNITSRHAVDLLTGRWTMADVRQTLHETYGPAEISMRAKPGIIPLLVFTAAVNRLSDTTPALLMAMCSLLTAMGLYLLARQGFGMTMGLVATLLFVLSGMALVFSRNYKLEVAPSWLFLTLGTWAYLRSRQTTHSPWLWVSGLLLGYSFACNYTVLLPLGLFPLFEFFWPVSPHAPLVERVKRITRIGIGILIPLTCFQLVAMAIKCAWPAFPSYWSFVIHAFRSQFHHKTQQADPLFYLYFLWQLDGPLTMFLLAIGTATFLWLWIKRRAFVAFMVLSLFYGPLVVLSLSTQTIFTVPRSMTPILPFGAIIGAAGLLTVMRISKRWFPQPAAVVVGFVVGIVGIVSINLHHIFPVTCWRSGYRQAAQFIQANSTLGVADPADPALWQFYLRRFLYVPEGSMELRQLYETQRVRYLVMEPASYILSSYSSSLAPEIQSRFQQLVDLVAHVPPTAVFEHPVSSELVYLAELGHLSRWQFLQVQRDPQLRYIRVFDLQTIFGPLPPSSIQSADLPVSNPFVAIQ